jgi:hypothetical protein
MMMFQIPTWKVYLRDNTIHGVVYQRDQTVYRVPETELAALLKVLVFNGQPFDVRLEDADG